MKDKLIPVRCNELFGGARYCRFRRAQALNPFFHPTTQRTSRLSAILSFPQKGRIKLRRDTQLEMFRVRSLAFKLAMNQHPSEAGAALIRVNHSTLHQFNAPPNARINPRRA
jgi:hypothetical protein